MKIRPFWAILMLSLLLLGAPVVLAEARPGGALTIGRTPAGQWELPLALLGYGETLRLSGQLGEQELVLPIPDGLNPLELRAQAFTPPDVEGGYMEVLNGQNALLTLALSPPQMSLRIPLDDVAVQGQRLYLSFLVHLHTVEDTCADSTGVWLELRSATLVLGGEARPPSEVDTFFPPILSVLRLYVSPSPTSAESEAALNLAMAVAHRYAPQKPVIKLEALAQDEALPLEAEATPFERAVIIREGPATQVSLEPNQASGWPSLLLSGPASALRHASRLLADELAPAAPAPTLGAIEKLQGERLALSSLGTTKLRVSGVGRMEIPFSFAQADLGGPIRALAFRLRGTYTPPATGAQAILSIYFNSALLRMAPLGRKGAFDLHFSIPKELLYRDNVLVVRFDYTPPEGRYRLEEAPFTVQISPESYIRVRRGQALPPGFNRFPQALSQGFEVAFEQFDRDSLANALGLVVALQRLSKCPLRLTVVPWGSALSSKEPALLVATHPHSVAALRPSLIPEPLAITDSHGHEVLRLEAEATFAALEAFESRGRDVLLLTCRGDQGRELQRQLVSALEAHPQGWRALRGDVLLQTGSARPQALRLRGGGLKVKPLTIAELSWWPSLRSALYLAASGLLLVFLAWAYPRVVRHGLSQ